MLKEISIEIIRKCPNNCVHCSSLSSISCKEIISYQKFKEVVDDAKELGLKTVCFSGGEPFLHPNICEMVEYVHSLGLNSYIYSSGIFTDAEGKRSSIPLEILDRISNKITKIILNIEAIDLDVYDRIMGTTECFCLLEKTIKSAIAYGILLEAHFVPMKPNLNQINKVIEFCIKEKISKISFLRLVAHGRAKLNEKDLVLSNEEQHQLEVQLTTLKEQKGNLIRIGTPLLGETEETHCEAANGKLNIKYDGNVFPCEVFKNLCIKQLDLHPSNIHNQRLISIYNQSNFLKQIREMIKKFSLTTCCENCIGQYIIKQLDEGDKNGN